MSSILLLHCFLPTVLPSLATKQDWPSHLINALGPNLTPSSQSDAQYNKDQVANRQEMDDGEAGKVDKVLSFQDKVAVIEDQALGSQDGFPVGEVPSSSQDGVAGNSNKVSLEEDPPSPDLPTSVTKQRWSSHLLNVLMLDKTSSIPDGISKDSCQVSTRENGTTSQDGLASSQDELPSSRDGISRSRDGISSSQDGISSSQDGTPGNQDLTCNQLHVVTGHTGAILRHSESSFQDEVPASAGESAQDLTDQEPSLTQAARGGIIEDIQHLGQDPSHTFQLNFAAKGAAVMAAWRNAEGHNSTRYHPFTGVLQASTHAFKLSQQARSLS